MIAQQIFVPTSTVELLLLATVTSLALLVLLFAVIVNARPFYREARTWFAPEPPATVVDIDQRRRELEGRS